MSQVTSSGTKLYEILDQAWKYDNPRELGINVWTKILGADVNDRRDIAEKFSQLLGLINDVEADTKSLEISDIDGYLDAIKSIQEALLFSNTFNIAWTDTQKLISKEHINLIRACGHLIISQKRGVKELSSEEVNNLLKELQSLINDVLELDIDAETKSFLVSKLREIEEVILNYKIRGSSGLQKANNQAVGGIFYFISRKNISLEKIKPVLDWLSKLHGSLGLADQGMALFEGIKNMFSLPPGSS